LLRASDLKQSIKAIQTRGGDERRLVRQPAKIRIIRQSSLRATTRLTGKKDVPEKREDAQKREE
jgi:hypothetical protein